MCRNTWSDTSVGLKVTSSKEFRFKQRQLWTLLDSGSCYACTPLTEICFLDHTDAPMTHPRQPFVAGKYQILVKPYQEFVEHHFVARQHEGTTGRTLSYSPGYPSWCGKLVLWIFLLHLQYILLNSLIIPLIMLSAWSWLTEIDALCGLPERIRTLLLNFALVGSSPFKDHNYRFIVLTLTQTSP